MLANYEHRLQQLSQKLLERCQEKDGLLNNMRKVETQAEELKNHNHQLIQEVQSS